MIIGKIFTDENKINHKKIIINEEMDENQVELSSFFFGV